MICKATQACPFEVRPGKTMCAHHERLAALEQSQTTWDHLTAHCGNFDPDFRVRTRREPKQEARHV